MVVPGKELWDPLFTCLSALWPQSTDIRLLQRNLCGVCYHLLCLSVLLDILGAL